MRGDGYNAKGGAGVIEFPPLPSLHRWWGKMRLPRGLLSLSDAASPLPARPSSSFAARCAATGRA